MREKSIISKFNPNVCKLLKTKYYTLSKNCTLIKCVSWNNLMFVLVLELPLNEGVIEQQEDYKELTDIISCGLPVKEVQSLTNRFRSLGLS